MIATKKQKEQEKLKSSNTGFLMDNEIMAVGAEPTYVLVVSGLNTGGTHDALPTQMLWIMSQGTSEDRRKLK